MAIGDRHEEDAGLARAIAQAIEQGEAGGRGRGPLTLRDQAPAAQSTLSEEEEFFLLLKPELLDHRTGVKVEDAVLLVLGTLASHDCTTTAAWLMASDSEDAARLVQAQYFVLSCVAERGLEGLPPELHGSLAAACATRFPGARPVGASEAVRQLGLRHHDELQRSWDSRASEKLGPGLYGCLFDNPGPGLLVLNGFYPTQRAWLTQPGGHLLGLSVRAPLPLARFRAQVVGTIHPSESQPGSIRQKLHAQRTHLRLPEVSISRNGVHVAPNAFDTMLAIGRIRAPGGQACQVEASTLWAYATRHAPSLLPALTAYTVHDTRPTLLQYQLHTHGEDLCRDDALALLRSVPTPVADTCCRPRTEVSQ